MEVHIAEESFKTKIVISSGKACMLKFLQIHQVSMVNEALNPVGDLSSCHLDKLGCAKISNGIVIS
jgi:hypothetical protein